MADKNLSAFIWSVAELLRDNYKKSDYGQVILAFTVLRRIDCVLEAEKRGVCEKRTSHKAPSLKSKAFRLNQPDVNSCSPSLLGLKEIILDEGSISKNINAYIQSFSPTIKGIFESFEFETHIDRLNKTNLLSQVTRKFTLIDLHPTTISNTEMGTIFEELIRKFAELSNDIQGEHFTPREVINLMVNLLFSKDKEALLAEDIVKSIYDPTAGTGGMLSVAEEHIKAINPSAKLIVSGQEINPESYAICKADMLIRGQDINNICLGNTLSHDHHAKKKYDYMLSNPPFGVDWKKVQKEVKKEYRDKGFSGRFGPGLPRVSDGSLLFLMHLISKMLPASKGGSRIGIVLSGSPMFTGSASSGESEIRRYVLENDYVEAIIQLPQELFYNTAISTYIWIITNKKESSRKGKVQLIDCSTFSKKMRKSLGSKRQELRDNEISEITKIFNSFKEVKTEGKSICRILKTEELGYKLITVDRPKKDIKGNVITIRKGKYKGSTQFDPELRDTESIPLSEPVDSYFKREILTHYPDAWINEDKTKIGYEILFNRYFYNFPKIRSLEKINQELRDLFKVFSTLSKQIIE
ncbi:type I restriction-modification system subunit M [Prochlorococcus marinus]|uniref:type I restriction-modification system subunit M n=1 Tax=Prochlorococcus marinus TaxID=1219 RepID=UPI0039A4E050